MNITILGFVCRDRNVLPNGQMIETTGGKGFYSSAAASRCGLDVTLITWLPPGDQSLLLGLQDYPINIHVIEAETAVVCSNAHTGNARVSTRQVDPKILGIDDFDEAMMGDIMNADLVHVAPELQEKISLDFVRHLRNDLGLRLSVDPGHFLQEVDGQGELQPKVEWLEKVKYLPYFDTVFMSTEDIKAIAKEESLLSAARNFSDHGPQEIVITKGDQGSFIFSQEENEAIDVPAFLPGALVDPTGAGDTYIGAYLAKRSESHDLEAAGRFAAMAAGLKVGYSGPLREPAEVIEQRLLEMTNPKI